MRRNSREVVVPAEAPPPREPWPAAFGPRAVIEALEPLVTVARQRRLERVLGDRLDSVTLVMDAPHDPHNGGAVQRSADAFGVQRVHVVARSEPFAISTTVTRGSEKWVELVHHPTPVAAVDALTRAGFELVSTHPDGELAPEDLSRIPRLALVFGNEHDGISEELLASAARSVRVPMRGFVESLNVSVSAAVLLAAATRGRPGDLPLEEREHLYARALYLSVAQAPRILGALALAGAIPGGGRGG